MAKQKRKENKNKNKKVSKAGKVARIAIKIILFLIGVALLAFFVWIGLQVALVLGIKWSL